VGWGIDDESDPAANARALREAENGLRQARRVADLIRSGVPSGASPLTSAVIAELNGLAVDGIVSTAGKDARAIRPRDQRLTACGAFAR
jgi:hypothetical protein